MKNKSLDQRIKELDVCISDSDLIDYLSSSLSDDGECLSYEGEILERRHSINYFRGNDGKTYNSLEIKFQLTEEEKTQRDKLDEEMQLVGYLPAVSTSVLCGGLGAMPFGMLGMIIGSTFGVGAYVWLFSESNFNKKEELKNKINEIYEYVPSNLCGVDAMNFIDENYNF